MRGAGEADCERLVVGVAEAGPSGAAALCESLGDYRPSMQPPESEPAASLCSLIIIARSQPLEANYLGQHAEVGTAPAFYVGDDLLHPSSIVDFASLASLSSIDLLGLMST